MQRANLIAFIVLSGLVLAGWFWLASPTDPPKVDDPDKKEKLAKKEAKDKEDADKKAKDDQDKAAKEKAKKDKEDAEKKANDKVPPKPQIAQEALLSETLGGEGFHLTVKTISRGAAVRSVTLNRFKAADWHGRPTDRDLELIQDDEHAPSFRMYHYVDPMDKLPVFGLGEANWKLEGRSAKDATTHEVRYSTNVPGMDYIRIVKTYRLGPQDYHVTMLLEMENLRKDANLPMTQFRYQVTGAQGLPIEGEWFTATFRNAMAGVVDQHGTLWRKLEESMTVSRRGGGDTVPEDKYEIGESRLQFAGVANQYFGVMIVVDDKQPDRADFGVPHDKILAWARPTLESAEKKGTILKIGDDGILFTDESRKVDSYLLLPRTKQHLADLELKVGDKAVISFYETPDGRKVASWVRLGETLKPQFDDITVRVNSQIVQLHPRAKVKHQFMLYHGPVKAALLAQFSGDKEVPGDLVDRYTETLHLRTLTDYPNDNWFSRVCSRIGLTWLIIKFTSLMHWLLHLINLAIGWIPGSYGLSIIVLTVMVRGAMFPISRRTALFSMKMQELAPELKAIQAKYPDDAGARMQATQAFYRKHGINPLGSCWPMFLQMPIFLGLYYGLQESIHFRLAEFLWVKSLAAPDMLLYWTETIPVISSPDHSSGFLGALYLGPYLNILPVLAVVFMMIQQMQTMPPPTDEQQEMQQKMLKYMSVIFGVMFYKVAAGLCIYFIAGSLWGMAERKLLPKKNPAVTGAAGDSPPGGGSGPGGGPPMPPPPMPPKGKSKWDKKEKEKEKDPGQLTTFDKLKALWREILKQAEKK